MSRGTAVVLLLALFATQAIAAPIYKTKDEHGNVVYTDDPQGRPAEVVELPDLTVVPATPLTGPPSGSTGTDEEATPPLRR